MIIGNEKGYALLIDRSFFWSFEVVRNDGNDRDALLAKSELVTVHMPSNAKLNLPGCRREVVRDFLCFILIVSCFPAIIVIKYG